MALNFNALRQAGPANFYEGLVQGQQEVAQNAMAQQKMAQEQQKMGQEQEMNALRVQQLKGTIGEQEATRKKQSLLDKTSMFRERLLRAPTPEAAREIVKMQYADPDIGPVILQGGSLEQSLAEVSDDPALFDRYKQQEAMGMSEWMKSQLPKTVGGSIYLPSENRFMQPPAAPEKAAAVPVSIAEYERSKTDPQFMRFLQERSAANRAPAAAAQPVAPTIAQIVDPANPNQMITIDARRYQGGGAGSPGVIGVAGKEPSAALRTNKVEAGKSQLADDLDNLRTSFQTLNDLRAIPSTERGVMSNIGSATAASGIGQMLGRATGTEAQVERDVINSARQRLVNSIKNATGMSAQQLNSNVELQTMLKSISDPGQSIQAAMRIIDDIEAAYVTGNGTLPKRNMPSAVSGKVVPAAAAPNLDALLNKYK